MISKNLMTMQDFLETQLEAVRKDNQEKQKEIDKLYKIIFEFEQPLGHTWMFELICLKLNEYVLQKIVKCHKILIVFYSSYYRFVLRSNHVDLNRWKIFIISK